MLYLIESTFKVIVNLSSAFRNRNADVVVCKQEQEDLSDCACSPSTIHLMNMKAYPREIFNSGQDVQSITEENQRGER